MQALNKLTSIFAQAVEDPFAGPRVPEEKAVVPLRVLVPVPPATSILATPPTGGQHCHSSLPCCKPHMLFSLWLRRTCGYPIFHSEWQWSTSSPLHNLLTLFMCVQQH